LKSPEAEMLYLVSKGLFARKIMTDETLVSAKTIRIESLGIIKY
jgi:hypothetical protein